MAASGISASTSQLKETEKKSSKVVGLRPPPTVMQALMLPLFEIPRPEGY